MKHGHGVYSDANIFLVCFSEDADAADIDCEKYHMEKLNLRSIVADPKASVVNNQVLFPFAFSRMAIYNYNWLISLYVLRLA